ncbi:MAG: pilus assembly protein [Lachnospiraceae bacterium]|nr:pilus assembly protein [Lachnospiraceae bacterium]
MRRAVRAVSPGKKRQIGRKRVGSLTVEAALVLPLCICAAVFFCGMFRAVSAYEQVNAALCQAARELAAASIEDEDTASARGYAYFLESCLTSGSELEAVQGGVYGVLVTCQYDETEKTVSLKAAYRVNIPGVLLPDRGITVTDQAVSRKWRGADGIGPPSESVAASEDDQEMVYITDNQSVYHVNPDCTHLKLTISEVSAGAVGEAVNIYGAHYRPCEKCSGGSDMEAYVYISPEGDCWHNDSGCSGLKRSVREISRKEAEEMGLGPCLRCGGAE